jgi:small GTP-binding protein
VTPALQKKICMVGAYGVGKTSLVKRFVQSLFDEKYQTTIGVKIDKKVLDIDGVTLTLMIWDLAGEDEVEQVRLSNLRGASGYILVADGCRARTLDCAIELLECVDKAVGPIPFVLAVNKADLRQDWNADLTTIEHLHAADATVFETSAKTGDSVEEMFRALGRKMLLRPS